MHEHKAPWQCVFAKEEKSLCKPGDRPSDDSEYFEILCLCVLQAGLSWKAVRENWEKIKKGFYSFNIEKLCKANASELVRRPGVYNNRRKIEAIIANARVFQKLKEKYGSFSNFLETLKSQKDKEAINEIKKLFKHIGDYSAEYFLHSVGFWK